MTRRPRLAPCLAALIALGASLLIRRLPAGRGQARSPEPAEHPEPVERRLSPEDAARIALAPLAYTPPVSTRLQ